MSEKELVYPAIDDIKTAMQRLLADKKPDFIIMGIKCYVKEYMPSDTWVMIPGTNIAFGKGECHE